MAGSERRRNPIRGTVGSSDPASRCACEARGRFAQTIPLLRDAGQLPTELGRLLIASAPVAHKCLLRLLAQFPPPAPEERRPNPQVRRDLTDADAGHVEHRHRFPLILRLKLPPLCHDTPPGTL